MNSLFPVVILRCSCPFMFSSLVNLFPLSDFDPMLTSVPCLSSIHCLLSLSLNFPVRWFLQSFSKSLLPPKTTDLSLVYCLAFYMAESMYLVGNSGNSCLSLWYIWACGFFVFSFSKSLSVLYAVRMAEDCLRISFMSFSLSSFFSSSLNCKLTNIRVRF